MSFGATAPTQYIQLSFDHNAIPGVKIRIVGDSMVSKARLFDSLL